MALTAAGTVAAPARATPFGYHEHDGFYLRMAGGIGSIDVTRSTDQAGIENGIAYTGDTSTFGGTSIFTELSIGATPFRRVVLAGTFLGDNLPTAELELASGSRFSLASTFTFAMLAASVDIFPDPNRGFHVGGGIGWAAATAHVSDPIFTTIGGGGPGVTVEFGYDAWVGDDWSIGAIARGVVADIRGQQSATAGVGHEHDAVTSASLAFSLLYH